MPDIAVFMSFAKPALSQTNMKRVPIACYCYIFAIPKAGSKVVISKEMPFSG